MVEELKDTIARLEEDAEKAAAERRKKDELIEELESKVRRQRREIEELEEVCAKLKVSIREAEEKAHARRERGPRREERPPKPTAEVDNRARVAAVAIALVGSILWISSR